MGRFEWLRRMDGPQGVQGGSRMWLLGQRSLKEHEEGGTALEGPRDLAQCIWVFYEGDMTRLGEEAEALDL